MLLPLAISLAACAGSDLATLAPGPADSRDNPAALADSGLRWSQPKSWPGRRVPSAGDDVVVPEGRRILLDVSPPELRSLVVRGALVLPLADTTPRAIVAGHIEVRGLLAAGSGERPYAGRLTITLTGRSDAAGLLHKAISVFPGGALELHGPERVSWTRLAATAGPGATQLSLARAVDWRPGDRIVVAPSGWSQDEAEMRVLRAVDGRTVQLDAPLEHRHDGDPLRIAGIDVERRAEVGLLTRGIRLEGDASAEESGAGGHVIVFQGGVAHVAGVEFHRMGQRGELARYPMHWHMADHAPGQYVVNSSVWRSFNRCVTVHGTHDVTVADNVCYDHTGHGYFLEDGIETNNSITGNLALRARLGTVLASDALPANFWITHPDNVVEDNVAAGSPAFGFWYALQDHPTGPSATTAVRPRFTPLRSFRRNLAHAIHGDALHIEGAEAPGTYSPRVGADQHAAPVVASFEDFTVYRSSRAYWSRGDHIRLTRPVLVDNGIAMQAGQAGGQAEGELVGGLVAGRSEPGASGGPAIRHGVMLYDGPVRMRGVTFANFDGDGSSAVSGAFAGGVVSGRFSIEGSRFVDARPVLMTGSTASDGERMTRLLDVDGSATGVAGATVVASHDFLLGEGCEARPEWKAHVCRGGYAAILLEGVAGLAPATVEREDGRTERYAGYTAKALYVTVPTERRYIVRPESGVHDAFNLYADGLAEGESITVAVPVSERTYRALYLDPARAPVPLVESMQALASATRTAIFFDRASGLMHVRLVGAEGQTRPGVYVYGD
jgi:cell migration-inducing and hyaluronan-binding protein